MLLAATACGGKKAEETSGSNAAKETAKISAMQVDDVLAHADTLVGKTVTLEGVCTHICSHGGRKIFLMGSDDTQTIRIEGGRIGKFAPECVNKVVTVEGIVREDRIDEEYLRRRRGRVQLREESPSGDRTHPRRAHSRLPYTHSPQRTGNRPGISLVLPHRGHKLHHSGMSSRHAASAHLRTSRPYTS